MAKNKEIDFSFFPAKDEQERTEEMVHSSQVCSSSF